VLSLVTAYRSSGRSWQARHPPRYAAFLTPPSPSCGHSSGAAILAYIAETNADPKPFTWTKAADDILARFCQRTSNSSH